MPEPEQQPKDEKLEYLKRDEIRTMGKDVGALREAEAQRERQRVAKMRVGEERKQESARQETAAQATQERSEAAKAARQKEEEVATLKEEWTAREEAAKTEAIERARQREARLGKEMEKVQGPEEQARKSFLERVEAKVEGLPAEETAPERPRIPAPEMPKPTTPAPPRPPKIPSPPAFATLPVATKPTAAGLPWTKIAISLSALAVLGAVGTFWYWYFVVKPAPVQPPPPPSTEQPEQPVKEEPIISAPQITEALVEAGYRVPTSPRTITTLIIHSIYNILEGDSYSVNGILEEYRQLNVAHHYLIARDGAVYRAVAEENIAYHAGPSRNASSIGIGIINTGTDTPTQAQYQALAGLVKQLKEKYAISDESIFRRQDVIADSPNNPANFDWNYFNSLIAP
ncbi:MAG: N-acetylmuramoyl-L-alanine amidase [Candidatus Nealsonbacteria bacterium]|nr:N-acetylmuramoyl-L-alanine amidase [Candidatus Nealsonbacteria bacterium]